MGKMRRDSTSTGRTRQLLRYGSFGQERPGLLYSDGRIRSLWPAVADLTPEGISPEGLRVLAALDTARLPLGAGPQRIEDSQNVDLRLEVNGVQRQRTNTSDMVFNVRHIVSHISEMVTWLPALQS
jgi:hypothetical protein